MPVLDEVAAISEPAIQALSIQQITKVALRIAESVAPTPEELRGIRADVQELRGNSGVTLAETMNRVAARTQRPAGQPAKKPKPSSSSPAGPS